MADFTGVTRAAWLGEFSLLSIEEGPCFSRDDGKKGLMSFCLIIASSSMGSDVPFRVAQLTTFEVTKNVYLRAKKRRLRLSSSSSNDENVSLSALEAAACGAVAGSFSAAITNPLDRIKTLMMTDVTNAYGGSVATCASRMIRDDGLAGLFAGVVPRVAYIAPSVCIFFATYEFVHNWCK